jgi:hypothetical protein
MVIGMEEVHELIKPGESCENPTLDEVLDLSICLLLDEVVDEGSRGLTLGKVGGDRIGVIVLQSCLQERVQQLEAVL